MDPQFLQFVLNAWNAIAQHQWLLLATVVCGFVVRLLADDTKFPIDIPRRWLPVATVAVTTLYSALESILKGTTWQEATVNALKYAFVTMGLFDVVVKAWLNGKDMPPFLTWLLKPAEGKQPPQNG